MLRRLETLEVFDGRGARREVRLHRVHSGEGAVPAGLSAEEERSAHRKQPCDEIGERHTRHTIFVRSLLPYSHMYLIDFSCTKSVNIHPIESVP